MPAPYRNIAELSPHRTDHHLALAEGQDMPGRDRQELVAAHVRSLKALYRSRIVGAGRRRAWVAGDLPVPARLRRTARVRWKPVIEQRPGQQRSTSVRGGMAS